MTRFPRTPSRRDVLLGLLAICGFSTLLRIALVTGAHAPLVFNDELGYEKLAQSIGKTGHLALFNERGLSYSPLYSVVLSPIFALGASAPTAYSLIKIVNAFLISLAVFPTYKIARFALPRRASLLVAAVSALAAPLMLYSSFSMSENVAYPLCLTAIWAMLEALRAPGPRNDALLLGAIALACVARVQMIFLIPAAVTAVVLAGALGREKGISVRRSLLEAAWRHRLLVGVLAGGFMVAALRALAGQGVFSIAGRYANVGTEGLPDPWRFLYVGAQHLAGLDLAVGVVPFVGAIVAALAFARSGFRRDKLPFAAVAVAVTTWLLIEVAWDAAVFDGHGGDAPRIHERFLIYLVPFFVTAVVATISLAESHASARICFGAAAFAALLPVVIPFHDVVNQTIAADTFSLEPFAQSQNGKLVPIPYITLAVIWFAATLGLLYVRMRRRTRMVVVIVLIPFVLITGIAWDRIETASAFTRSLLPKRTDWVDAAKPQGDVILISGPSREDRAFLETAYGNLSISRLYFTCRLSTGPEFGERQATIDGSGRLRGPSGPLKAQYVVAERALGIRGRVVARNTKGHQVLVAPLDGLVSAAPGRRAALKCKAS